LEAGWNAHAQIPPQAVNIVTNPTVYNRSIYKYNLIDVYKYNLIDASINVFLESLERKFMLAIFIHGNLV
jgi:hypothetical protein